MARALRDGARRARPFVHLDCAGLPEPLFESELFGHQRGAFTGADRGARGARRGGRRRTLFLDELGELPPRLQAKLLRLLQERSFERVGGGAPRAFRARVIAATHVDLDAAARAGAFRRDLLFRLDVARIVLPPLRERREDLPALARGPLARAAERLGLVCPRAAPGLSRASPATTGPATCASSRTRSNAGSRAERRGVAPREAERIARTLAATGGNVARAARRLGLPRSTLRGRIARLNPLSPRGSSETKQGRSLRS